MRNHASPKESHLLAVKKIIKYVSGIIEYGLWYTQDTTTSLIGYCDVDWAGNFEDRKNIYGGCFSLETTLCHGLVENKTASYSP